MPETEPTRIQLFHFTKLENLPGIAVYCINQSWIGLSQTHGISVPVLTSKAEVEEQTWAASIDGEKLEVRITLAIPPEDIALRKFEDFFWANRGNEHNWNVFREIGNPEDWYVYMRPIPLADGFVTQVSALQNIDGIYSYREWPPEEITAYLETKGVVPKGTKSLRVKPYRMTDLKK